MKNISSKFKDELNNGNRSYEREVQITLKNGTVLDVDNTDLWQNGLTVYDSVSSENSFDIGSVIIGHLTLTLNNIYEEYSEYDFTDCVANSVKIGLKLSDNTIEYLSYGKYYLNDSTYNGSIITLNFYDGIYKFDTDYSKSILAYPATLGQIVADACDECGITLGTFSFPNDDYLVKNRPSDENLTFRQVLSWVGQIACGFFRMDEEGRLTLNWYDTDVLESLPLDNEEEINPTDFQLLSSFSSINTGLDDIVITGVKLVQEVDGENGTEDVVYQSGNDGYVIEISGNKLISQDDAQQIVTFIGSKIIGLKFRTFSVNMLSNPTIEAGDIALIVDRKGYRYGTFITNNTFQPGNYQNLSCGATPPARQSAARYSAITQVYVDYRKDLQKERTEREEALSELEDRVNNSSGLFTTIETQSDGSKIYYMHNKPQLADSDIIWTMTAEAWTVSTNGNETLNAGMTVDGDTIVRILSAVGVNADWIKTGAFTIEKDGNIMFKADTETGQIDIVANSFSLQGNSIEDIASQQVDNFIDSIYTPQIDNLQKQIDGQIMTYYYDYEPTLQNEPASEWQTEEERSSHEGDLFYWKSKGYAYRFFKDDDGNWKWQMVQDTDITLALQQAAAAQDTADQKRRVFVTTPTPPYDIGDLWVGNDTSELMRCQRARTTGNYDATDWIKAVKYTDDTELNTFIYGDYAETIQNIYNSVDQKAETWYQTTDPSLEWTDKTESDLIDTEKEDIIDTNGDIIKTIWESEKYSHEGDLWKDPSDNVEYIYQNGKWIEMGIPDEVFDTIDGKAQIFVVQPTPPYSIGDVWFTGTSILVCSSSRDSGSFDPEDWAKKDNYTDDSALYDFIENDYYETVQELQQQSDKKAETWYQETDPAVEWSSDEKIQHTGDLWYSTSDQKTYIYNGSVWEEAKSNPPDEVFDEIDGKAQIFVDTPVPPYAVGDLWFDSSSSDIMTCVNSRGSGDYSASDWEKRNKYTDDSALNNFISGEYSETIEELKTQADQKAETWYQPNDPSQSWTAAQKEEHTGDIWYNMSDQKTYIYNGSSWQETKTTPPDEVFDQIDGKAQIFISQPSPPYSIGDLWFNSTTSDIMTCIESRNTGSFNSGDWQKRNKYTDDSLASQVSSELSQFVLDYNDEMADIIESIDKKAETWYQTEDPSLDWTQNVQETLQDTTGKSVLDLSGNEIETIFEWEKTIHEGDLWHNPSNNNEYIYVDGQWIASSIPDEVFDIIDGKAQIFVSQPTAPYAIGDLWFNSDTSDIMTCINGRESGNFSATDWQKRNKYTDDSYAETVKEDLDNFSTLVTGDMENLQVQIDGKIETYYYDYQPTLSNLPASEWTDSERITHVGDLFYWESKGFTYRFMPDGNSFKWQPIQDSDIEQALEQASQAQDTADSKRRVFYSTPVPPYDVGDLWAQGANGDIMRCRTARQSGNYVSTDWEKASKYTDDSALDEFINGEFSNTISDLQEQADKKAETWYQSTDPSTSWTTTAIKNEHVGDIWYNTSSSVQKSYRWNGTSWQEMKTTPPDEVFDEIDGKAQIFINTPTPPYQIGDLWFNSATSDIMTCIQKRESGTYNAADWEKRNKYTDDTAVDNLDESLDMQGVFNRLTNNGEQQGLFIKDETLYLNAEYIVTGTLSSKDGKSSWNLDTGVLIVGDESSRINAGILQSPNYTSNGSGIQINLNTGIVKGEIEASSFSARDNLKIYNDGKEHTLVTGNYSTDGMIITTIGCDLENFSTSQTPIPSIALNKSGSTGVVTINAGSIGLNGSVSTGHLITGDINAAGNVSLTGKLIADSASITNIISAYGFDGGWIIESGNRMRVDWRQNSSGVWTLYFYIDDQLVRTW